MKIKRFTDMSPVPSDFIGWAEIMELTGVHPSSLGELIELGWIEPMRTGGEGGGYLFRRRDVYRVRKFSRLCADFNLPSIGGTIIVDLLERIDHLERKVRELERIADPRRHR